MNELYSKEQLIEAMQKWNVDLSQNPTDYEELGSGATTKEYAIRQVEHLLSFVEKV